MSLNYILVESDPHTEIRQGLSEVRGPRPLRITKRKIFVKPSHRADHMDNGEGNARKLCGTMDG